jgi:hypothetical protein
MHERRDRLSAPFPASALRWRVLEVDPADHRARLAPELSAEAVVARLDEVCGAEGWSKRYLPFGAEALVCELTIDGVTKAEVVHARSLQDLPEALAESALSRAAGHFGLRPPVDDAASAWVDADPESGEPLHLPELGTPSVDTIAAPAPDKPAGQVAIDRLVERLREDGLGLEAAKLLIEYGGYGDDPETARDLYGKLRDLLRDRSDPE